MLRGTLANYHKFFFGGAVSPHKMLTECNLKICRSLLLAKSFKSCAAHSEKRWTLLIGEDQTNSTSKKLKRGVTKRIGSMADMHSFLKYIRLFRQSRGVFGQFAKPKKDC